MTAHAVDLAAIGENVKKLRQGEGWSLDELSLRSGVSKAMLSNVESGKVNPTIATLWKIALAFEVDFNVLLRGEGSRVKLFTICRRDDLTSLDVGLPGARITVLSPPAMADDLELYMLELEPGSALESEPHTAGAQEFVTVLAGEVEVAAGERSTVLNTGDLVHYQCDVHHRIRNRGAAPARLYMVVRFPERP